AAAALDAGGPQSVASRPCPAPPVALRPRRLSATEVERLVRDPYAVYARRILRLRPLDPLGRAPEARDRGEILHAALAEAVEETRGWTMEQATPETLAQAFATAARARIDREVPRAAERRLWRARLGRAAEWFGRDEAARRAAGDRPQVLEAAGERLLDLPAGPLRLTARVDRVDLQAGGGFAIYDYKTGALPGAREIGVYALQLHLAAAMAASGGIEGLTPGFAGRLAYIGLSGAGEGGEARAADLTNTPVDEVWERVARHLARYDDPDEGYLSRRAPRSEGAVGDYDHLARAGEWLEAEDEA
ncbi:MAG: PD-(D/E)XK nuclease family protein, partial [Pseudomonadota bacterium]